MKTIDTNTLQELRNEQKDLSVINVLGRDAFQKKHIPGSENVPLDEEQFTRKVLSLAGGKEKPVVVYCTGKSCNASPRAGRRLEEAGFTQVYDYEAGVMAWEEAGFPLSGTDA